MRRIHVLAIALLFALPACAARERHAQHTADPMCRGCHRSIDALGFTFENFDFIGRVRSDENRHPIDTRTDYAGTEGPRRFDDSRDVARWLALEGRIARWGLPGVDRVAMPLGHEGS